MIDQSKLKALADAMAEKARAEEWKLAIMEPHKAALIEAGAIAKAAAQRITEIKELIYSEALEEYNETGKKKLSGGVGIRVSSRLDYDKDKALDFAKEKDMFLALDAKGFEAAAASLKLDFVDVVTVETVTFPKEVRLDG